MIRHQALKQNKITISKSNLQNPKGAVLTSRQPLLFCPHNHSQNDNATVYDAPDYLDLLPGHEHEHGRKHGHGHEREHGHEHEREREHEQAATIELLPILQDQVK